MCIRDSASGEVIRRLAPGSYQFQIRCQTHCVKGRHHWIDLKPGQDTKLKLDVSPGGFLHVDADTAALPSSPHPFDAVLHLVNVDSGQRLRKHRFLLTPDESGGRFARLSPMPHRNRLPFLLRPGRYAAHVTVEGYDSAPVEFDIQVDQVSTAALSLREAPGQR